MNQNLPKKEVAACDGDAELRLRLFERLNFLQERVERFDFYIKNVKKMLDEDSANVVEIEKLISRIEQEMGYAGSESTKDSDFRSYAKTDDTADLKTGNVDADTKQDSMKDHKIGTEQTEMASDDNMALRDGSKASDSHVKHFVDIDLTTSETLDESFNHIDEGKMVADKEIDVCCGNPLRQMGDKVATGGWFINEGELAVLAHDDGCCSLYDVANCESKGEFKPQTRVPSRIWRDCWILRAAGIDGCLGKYVVAAAAGNVSSAGFCSWEFYSKTVHSFYVEDSLPFSRKHPVSSNSNGNPEWWFKPCGPLLVSTASSNRTVKVFDIRDGEQVMKFETQSPVSNLKHCSPLQWKDKGKVVLAEFDKVSLWDVSSLTPRPLVSAQASNQKITALHIGNRDAESSKGVRKRVNQPDSVRNDGVFCTTDFINLLDFRHPSGVGMKIPISNLDVKSVFSIGDMVLLGGSYHQQLAGRNRTSPQVQQFSWRRQNPSPLATYLMPQSNTMFISDDITQVWGDSHFVMAVSGLGLGRFLTGDFKNTGVVLGPNDMCHPSFDFASSRILIISRNRPALWMNII